ncbi:hypothetical protein BGZ54_010418 [Gamsiella multidivaricata]|nr:hypothetical protein BGZ54_010418 [Gamsiella multidivaricata]
MNPQHQRANSSGTPYPAPTGYYPEQQQPNRQQQGQQIVQPQHQQPMYPVLPSMNHPPPPLMHHHDPAFAHHQPMQQAHMHLLQSFWLRQMHEIQNLPQDFKIHHLPLARIKKVMKTDDDVKVGKNETAADTRSGKMAKMISADAPMIFDKGCEIFITELTLRAWIHAEENKRRTLQRSDIAAAIAKTDMFDFLIDIVPREEYKISLPKEHKMQHGIAGHDRRRSQEMFHQPMPGPASATGPKGPGVAGAGVGSALDAGMGLEGYYPYGMMDNSTYTLSQEQQQQQQQQQQLQMQYMNQAQQSHPSQQQYDY